jgi:probable phosphoglycerate mutase
MTPSKPVPPSSARLFSDSEPAGPSAGVYLANIDGASRGNPGPASYAIVIRDPDGKIALELGKKLGQTTNNVAEYYALLAALDYATSNRITALRVRSDSELLVRQMQGRYKVKSPDLKPLYERALKLVRQIHYFKIEHVRRELNKDADALANVALDSGGFSTAAPIREASRSVEPGTRPATGESPTRRHGAFGPRSIRARFVGGVLVPCEPLEIPEGTEVVLNLRSPSEK